jgi:hypothetical protein
MIMTHFKWIIWLILLTSVELVSSFNSIFAQQPIKIQLIDSETKSGIPYAYIKVLSNNYVVSTDQDGFFSITLKREDSIKISHIAYEPIFTTCEKIQKKVVLEMAELPIELNPIIISAKGAETTLRRAIDSTFKVLSTPMYFTCYRKDQINLCDTLVVEAIAEIFFEVEKLNSQSHGGEIKSYLNNIKVERNPSFHGKIVPDFLPIASDAPINRFIAGVSKKDDTLLNFFYQEANDSVVIVSFKPKKDFIPKSNSLLMQGRFIIDKSTWKIKRIDSNLSPEMMKIGRSKLTKEKNPQRFIYYYSRSQFFNDEGLPSRVLWAFNFSFKEDNANIIWKNNSEMVLIKEKSTHSLSKNLIPLKADSSLIQMKSRCNSNFEQRFDNWIPKSNINRLPIN